MRYYGACITLNHTLADQDRLDDARQFDLEFLPLREVNPFTQVDGRVHWRGVI